MSALFQSGLVVIFFLFLHGRVKRRISFFFFSFPTDLEKVVETGCFCRETLNLTNDIEINQRVISCRSCRRSVRIRVRGY